MVNFREKYEELQNKAERINILGDIYDEVHDRMQWNAMDYHGQDEEHENAWFTAPENEDDYHWNRYQVYQEVLKAIEKLADK